jgi:6-pyruvoyltetrahydropterin/6-carboxytetrahydropterin synthase
MLPSGQRLNDFAKRVMAQGHLMPQKSPAKSPTKVTYWRAKTGDFRCSAIIAENHLQCHDPGAIIAPMFQLTRAVRFAINQRPDDQLRGKPTNGFAGFPSLTGLGHYFALQMTLEGPLQPDSGYLCNIKDIDNAVRQSAIPLIESRIRADAFGSGAMVLTELFRLLNRAWPGSTLTSLRLALSPFLSLSILAQELPMVRVSQKFEFSASHRLHNPALSAEQNNRLFGKCNNPHGHGHNYELQVTLIGTPDTNGELIALPQLERIVQSAVIDRFDHRNLNVELPEFKETNPTVENIAQVIYRLLKRPLADAGAKLGTVTLWETPKTFCEYGEDDCGTGVSPVLAAQNEQRP